jgi:hypothetical protein
VNWLAAPIVLQLTKLPHRIALFWTALD